MTAFNEKFQRLTALDDRHIGRYLISQDPIEGKIRGAFKDELILKSNACGLDQAKRIARDYPGLSLYNLLDALAVTLQYHTSHSTRDYIMMGYFEAPNVIVLFEKNISKVEALLQGLSLDIDVKAIILAHELFHYLETTTELYTDSVTVRLFKIGPIERRSLMIAPGEIAGMAFAKALLNLDFNPAILNYAFMYSINETEAEKIYQSMMRAL
ncbi:hypothetical protein O6R05_07830 [Peptoniphilus equinus]|uniref:Peptidase M48 domain-containing protein n=1 Tax=Peptoniphilus equinus TaxID=3016343 RepID=A0ABY7QV40_9FIRM|nr:hypothetical protein [Peptoniphilus equinus]WBW49900.1 hypothetical protein O6R05_07830 [Peptoniphilus equinus]